MPSSVLVFDVNETLLDLKVLNPLFERIMGDSRCRQEWFGQLLRSSLVSTVTGSYQDFGVLARGALRMIAARRGSSLSQGSEDEILEGLRQLPPHPEVPGALERLQERGLRLAALTNSPPAVAEAQIRNAGLERFFEKVLSVDAVRRFKPHREVYRYAARTLGIDISEMRLVAAHDWDVTGALRAGARAAFVSRPGMVLDPLAATPDIVGDDLSQIADRILAQISGI